MWSLNGECSLLDEGINLEYYSNDHIDSDESGEIACGRRQRRAVDYKKLYDVSILKFSFSISICIQSKIEIFSSFHISLCINYSYNKIKQIQTVSI